MTDERVTDGAEFVERQVNARHCPFCGAEHWILMPDIGAFTGGSPAEPGVVPPLTHHPAVSYSCGQCGFVRTHVLPQ
jgi:ribosomal protein S27AE